MDIDELTFAVALEPGDSAAAAELVFDTYWNQGIAKSVLQRAHEGSQAWVGARDAAGRLVATARALSDGAKHAWIYDVVVDPKWRGRGLGRALMRRLLDHPQVRGVHFIHLGTRDAQTFYERLGFVDKASIVRPYTSSEMVLRSPEAVAAHSDPPGTFDEAQGVRRSPEVVASSASTSG
jgi:ribosomal protein S18 acetylase RimI-like enzyme